MVANFNEVPSLLENLVIRNAYLLITDDRIIRLDRQTDQNSTHLTDLFIDFDLVLHVTRPTHDAGGLIDVLVSREDNKRQDVEVLDIVFQTIDDFVRQSMSAFHYHFTPPSLRVHGASLLCICLNETHL